VASYHIRLLGLIFLISFISCKEKKAPEDLMQDRIKLTKYKKQIEEIYSMQNAIKNKVPELVQKLKVANTPREKGVIVTKIQSQEKKMKRFKEKINILKKKILELENKGVTPLE